MARNANDTGPATKGVVVTPSNSDNISETASLYVTADGTLAVGFADAPGSSISLGTVTAGQILPFSVKRVYSTGTTATVVALY